MRVQNEQELGNAVKQEESCIELEGKLASHVKKLMNLNMALWVFSLTTLSVAVLALMQAPATAGVSGIISIVAGTSAASILGVDTVIAAVSIAVAGGGISILQKLRKYRLTYGKNGKIILHLNY